MPASTVAIDFARCSTPLSPLTSKGILIGYQIDQILSVVLLAGNSKELASGSLPVAFLSTGSAQALTYLA
jgi:hypothetical protein